ncbi:hypothetical protein KDW_39750 [Dictyobacter vulcani]|uniref:Uncharacterized protein n=1 Tax=Dictyobacter vulcani TaxID=2607529 RepID=A0A5J4KQD6_9CHLR|nr:hypothetical protein [Dictyobacter vulcani]GER89813.1 hypothetical protein KDW_39750 [Dictyobacter vulcani]
MNFLPAVLIGGPPQAGKSVLFYSVTHALRERNIPHHAIRACLDGEGNWTQESHPDTVSQIRLNVTTAWPASFVERISYDIEHRCLPFLIDMGGRPQGTQLDLFRLCTHSILLLREDEPDATRIWQRLIHENGVAPLAHITSTLTGESILTRSSPTIEGTLTGLHRHDSERVHGPVFELLVERIAALFNSYDL